jgi:hypothetical protein
MRYVVQGNDRVYGKVRYRTVHPILLKSANTLATFQSAETKDAAAVFKKAAAESKQQFGVKRSAVSHIPSS